jgi:Immunity protein 50
VSLPAGLESITGAQDLYDWFSYWPDFHDAEVLKFRLDPAAPSSLVVHTWEMTNRVNTQGYYELTKHAVVEFVLQGISKVDLVDLLEHSILLDLSVDKTETGFRLSFSAAYGLSGTIEAQGLSLRVTPGKPSHDV